MAAIFKHRYFWLRSQCSEMGKMRLLDFWVIFHDCNRSMTNFFKPFSREDWVKDNVEWRDGDSKIKYNQLRYFKFLPKESKGRLRDVVTVPNIPMIVSVQFAVPHFMTTKFYFWLGRLGRNEIRNSIGQTSGRVSFDGIRAKEVCRSNCEKTTFRLWKPFDQIGPRYLSQREEMATQTFWPFCRCKFCNKISIIISNDFKK